MSEARIQSIARRGATFALCVALGWLAWLPLGDAVSRAFCGVGDALLSPLTFGSGGHVALELAPHRELASNQEADEASNDGSWNGRLRLRIDGVEQEHAIRINPRRLLYLPFALLLALACALPLSSRARWISLGVGVPLVLASAVISVWITAAWMFGRVPGLVYDLSPFEQRLLHFAYEGLVTPLGNRLILPFLIIAPVLSGQALEGPRRASATDKSASARPESAPEAE